MDGIYIISSKRVKMIRVEFVRVLIFGVIYFFNDLFLIL